MLICENHIIGDTSVESDTSERVYTVTIGADDGKHRCTCPNWAITVNKRKKAGEPDPEGYQCKHIRRLLASNGCDWTENDPVPAKFPTVCPKCFAGTTNYLPRADNPTEEELDAAVQRILEWRQRLLAPTGGSPS